jgi:hypothetical protein
VSFQVGMAIEGEGALECALHIVERLSEFGYLGDRGVDGFWAELREGLGRFALALNGVEFVVLRPVDDRSLPQAQFNYLIRTGEDPPLFGAFRMACNACEAPSSRLHIIFADTWPDDDRVRIANGSIEELIGFLRAFLDWEGYVREVSGGEAHQGDQYRPLIFTVSSNLRQHERQTNLRS